MIGGWCGSECHGVFHQQLSMSAHAPVSHPESTVTCVSQPVYSCELNQFDGVGMSCQMWALCEAFRKWNGFGDDVIAEQPSHPCLHVHNTVCHVTPFVVPSSERMGVVFVVSMPFTVSLFACAMIDHSGFTNLHSKCTSSTVILLPHLHLSVCCVRREIWCATRHAWL